MNSFYREVQGVGMTSMRTRSRLVDRLAQQGITHPEVLEAVMNTPRHLFVESGMAHKAYEDTALPIGYGQTISQPFIVALMTELMLDDKVMPKRILEIGTGCGYQTAILSQLAKWVFTVERIEALQLEAKKRLPKLGFRNVSYLSGDGFLGWESNQPFDGIIVTAAPRLVPQSLLSQLAVGGTLVIPVGDNKLQQLRILKRTYSGYNEQQREIVKFVPMLNGQVK